MKKLALLLAVMFSCTNPERTISTLEKAGYTNIKTTGYSRGCADSDGTCTGFIARGPTGQLVEGSVGCGRIAGCSKGCTIRID